MNPELPIIQQPTPTRLERAAAFLFPAVYVDVPPGIKGVKDAINLEAQKKLNLIERLRILVSGRVRVTGVILTQNLVGQTRAQLAVYAAPPKWTEHKPIKLQPLILPPS